MAHYHKSRNQRKNYSVRFEQRYGMNRQAWRELKASDPQGASELAKVAYQRFLKTA